MPRVLKWFCKRFLEKSDMFMAYLLLHWVKTDYLHTFIRLFLSSINVSCEIKMWTIQHTITTCLVMKNLINQYIMHSLPNLAKYLPVTVSEKRCINAISLLIIIDWINLLCDFHHTYQINMKCSFRQILMKQSCLLYPVCIDKSTFVSLYNVYCILVPKKCIC